VSKEININNVIDCNIIKIIFFLKKEKKKYEKIDTGVFLLINYLIIFIFPISIGSLKISNTF
jgi:hypothetical protein